MKNQEKVNSFFESLLKNESFIKVCKYYNKDKKDVKKLLEKYTVILKHRNGEIKNIKIDFLETGSNLKIKHENKFKKHDAN